MPRALHRHPFVVHAVESTKAWAVGVRDGFLQQDVLAMVHGHAMDLLGAAKPWAQCRDPAQAAVLGLARAQAAG